MIFDWNLWSRRRRLDWTGRVVATGHRYLILFLDVPLATLKLRLEARNRARPAEAHVIPVWELERFATIFEPPGDSENLNLLAIRPSHTLDQVLAMIEAVA